MASLKERTKKTLILLVKKAFIAPQPSFCSAPIAWLQAIHVQATTKNDRFSHLLRFFPFFSRTKLNYQKLITYYFLPSKLEEIKVIWLCSEGIQARHSSWNYLEGMLHHHVNHVTYTHTHTHTKTLLVTSTQYLYGWSHYNLSLNSIHLILVLSLLNTSSQR